MLWLIECCWVGGLDLVTFKYFLLFLVVFCALWCGVSVFFGFLIVLLGSG